MTPPTYPVILPQLTIANFFAQSGCTSTGGSCSVAADCCVGTCSDAGVCGKTTSKTAYIYWYNSLVRKHGHREGVDVRPANLADGAGDFITCATSVEDVYRATNAMAGHRKYIGRYKHI